MMTKFNVILLSIAMTLITVNFAVSQETQNLNDIDEKSERSLSRRYSFFNYRGSNIVELSGGSAIINGDYPNPEFDIYFRIGYKYHLTSHLNINLSYNKYNIVFKELSNEGFMSFDLNLEFLLSPYTRFTPFFYIGGGYNAANYFATTQTKAQGGGGFEFIVAERIGIKVFGEYNYFFSDELDGLISGESDDTLLRMGLGLQFYFGGNKKKEAIRKKMKTVINSNPIILKDKSQSLFLQDQ